MQDSHLCYTEPFVQGVVSRDARAWKISSLAFLLGLGFAVLLSTQGGQNVSPQESAITIASTAPASVPAMMDKLKMFGVPSHPMEKLALTALVATRDVSARAQVKEAYAEMDPKSQTWVRQMNRDVIVKAESLKAQDMAGVTAPLGFWDPVGFSTDVPQGRLLYFREAELKHGRIAMMASLGILVADKFHPFFGTAGTFVSAIQAHKTAPWMVSQFWPALLGTIGLVEFLAPGDVYNLEKGVRAPGDFGFDPLGLKPKTQKEFLELQNKELNNGRLAMFAAMGLMFQEIVADTKAFPA